MKTNKLTIDSNAISKVFNRKIITGQSFSKMEKPINIMKREYFSLVYHTHDILSFSWVDVTISWLGVGGVWVFMTFFWLGMGWFDLFLAGCGSVWVCMIFFWLGVGGCRWMWPFFGWVWVSVAEYGWVSAWFITSHCFFWFKNQQVSTNSSKGLLYP